MSLPNRPKRDPSGDHATSRSPPPFSADESPQVRLPDVSNYPNDVRPRVRLPGAFNYYNSEDAAPSFADLGRHYRTGTPTELTSTSPNDGGSLFAQRGRQYRTRPHSPPPARSLLSPRPPPRLRSPPPPSFRRPAASERLRTLEHRDPEGGARRALPNETLHGISSGTGRARPPGFERGPISAVMVRAWYEHFEAEFSRDLRSSISNATPDSTATARSAFLDHPPEHVRTLAGVQDSLVPARPRAENPGSFHLPLVPPGFGYGGLASNPESSSTDSDPRRNRPATTSTTTPHIRYHHRSTSRNTSPGNTRAREPTRTGILSAQRTQNNVPAHASSLLHERLRAHPFSNFRASLADSLATPASRARSLYAAQPNVFPSAYFQECPAHQELLQAIIRTIYPSGSPPPTILMIITASDPDPPGAPSQTSPQAGPSTNGSANTTNATGTTPANAPFNARASITLFSQDSDPGRPITRIRHRVAFVHPPTAPMLVRRENPRAVSPERLAMLERRSLAVEDFSDGPNACGICLEEGQEGQQVTVLPCGHWFDRECIEAWLARHNSCPACRRPVPGGA